MNPPEYSPISRPVPSAPSAVPSARIAPMMSPASPPAKKGKAKTTVLVLLIIVLLGSTGTFGYLWWKSRDSSATLKAAEEGRATAERKLVTAETSIQSLESRVRQLEGTPTPTPTASTDAEKIADTASSYLATLAALKNKTLQAAAVANISSLDSTYASITYSIQNSSSISVVLKKSFDRWFVLSDSGVITNLTSWPTTDIVAKYSLPKDIMRGRSL
ncbi:hypothetical protein KBC99_02950 [Candidatus Saccharibacteria bacterium]|nr:hypothetical protein [Candidatus Saccharibacteria bacterium]